MPKNPAFLLVLSRDESTALEAGDRTAPALRRPPYLDGRQRRRYISRIGSVVQNFPVHAMQEIGLIQPDDFRNQRSPSQNRTSHDLSPLGIIRKVNGYNLT